MDIPTLTQFFTWCTLINGGLYLLWVFFCMVMPELVYRIQSKFFPMPRETFSVVIYAFLGVFKIFFLFFNVVPLVVLLIIG